MKKKILAIAAACAVFASMGALAACGGGGNEMTEEEARAALTEGHWSYGFTVTGYGTQMSYITFHDDYAYVGQPGTSGIICDIYDYEMKVQDYEYAVYYNREEMTKDGEEYINLHEDTAKYTVSFTSKTNSATTFSLGYDGSYIYANGNVTALGEGKNRARYTHDTDSNSTYKNQYALENTVEGGVEILTVYSTATKSVVINHNNTYRDLIGGEFEVTGTWTVSGSTYTLTPDSSSDTGATLVINSDGSGTYTPVGGSAITVNKDASKLNSTDPDPEPGEATALFTFEGEAANAQYESYKVPAALVLYDDGTCTVSLTVQGTSTEIDSGTYSIDYSSGAISITLTTAGTVSVQSDYTHYGDGYIVMSVTLSGYEGWAEFTLTYNNPVQSTPAAPEALFTFEGEAANAQYESYKVPATLVLYDDGTCKVSLTVQGTTTEIDSGTYTVDYSSGAISITLTTAGTVSVQNDYTHYGDGYIVMSVTLSGYEGWAEFTVSLNNPV